MPCIGGHSDPSPHEQHRQLTAKLLVFVYNNLQKEVPRKLLKAANDDYCSLDYTPDLCKELNAFSDHQTELIIYGKNRTSRALANWWEDHQEEDRQRVKKERGLKEASFTKRYGMTPTKYLSLEEEFYGFGD